MPELVHLQNVPVALQTDPACFGQGLAVVIQHRDGLEFCRAGLCEKTRRAGFHFDLLQNGLRDLKTLDEHADQRSSDKEQHHKDRRTNESGECPEFHVLLLAVLRRVVRGQPRTMPRLTKVLLQNACFFCRGRVGLFDRREGGLRIPLASQEGGQLVAQCGVQKTHLRC